MAQSKETQNSVKAWGRFRETKKRVEASLDQHRREAITASSVEEQRSYPTAPRPWERTRLLARRVREKRSSAFCLQPSYPTLAFRLPERQACSIDAACRVQLHRAGLRKVDLEESTVSAQKIIAKALRVKLQLWTLTCKPGKAIN